MATSERNTTPAARPVWLYGPAAGSGGEPTEPGATLAPDAPDTTPRPGLAVFAQAERDALAAWRAHAPRCGCQRRGRVLCTVGAALARRVADARTVLAGARS